MMAEYILHGRIVKSIGKDTYSQVSIQDFLSQFDADNDVLLLGEQQEGDPPKCEPPHCWPGGETQYNEFLDTHWNDRELCSLAYDSFKKWQNESKS